MLFAYQPYVHLQAHFPSYWPALSTISRRPCALIAHGQGVQDDYKMRPQHRLDTINLILKTIFAIMFGARQLLLAAVLAFHANALPAADPNDDEAKCSSSYSAYWSSSEEYEKPYATSFIYTTVYDKPEWSFQQGTTVLCDGRVRGDGPYEASYVETTETLDPPRSTVLFDWYTHDSPTCTEWTLPDWTPTETPTTDAATPDAPVQTSNPDSGLSPRDEPVNCGGSCYIYAQPNPVGEVHLKPFCPPSATCVR
jgi:hypothetical protein